MRIYTHIHIIKGGSMICTKDKLWAPIVVALGLPIMVNAPIFAVSGNIGQVDTFIQSIIKDVGGLAGLVAALFFVVGGYQYMTSSGSPERLERAKRTLVHAGVGLSIVIAAFVIANIVSGLATAAFGS